MTVAWPGTTSPPASGYSVRVFERSSGVERPIDAGCAGVIAALTCIEHDVPDGLRYVVTPRLENWVGLESTRSGPVSVETADPEPIGLTLQNVTGGTAGVIDPEGDQLSITFSEPLAVSSICSIWSDDTIDQTLTGNDVEVVITQNSGDNLLTVANSRCTLNIGSIALGNDYLDSSSATFAGTATPTVRPSAERRHPHIDSPTRRPRQRHAPEHTRRSRNRDPTRQRARSSTSRTTACCQLRSPRMMQRF